MKSQAWLTSLCTVGNPELEFRNLRHVSRGTSRATLRTASDQKAIERAEAKRQRKAARGW